MDDIGEVYKQQKKFLSSIIVIFVMFGLVHSSMNPLDPLSQPKNKVGVPSTWLLLFLVAGASLAVAFSNKRKFIQGKE